MDKVVLNSVQILVAIALMYAAVKYWNKKLRLGYALEPRNRAYNLFITGQVLSILVIIIYGIDEQNAIYLEGLSLFGSGALKFWSIIGIEVVGFVLVYMLSNLFGHLLYAIGYQSEKGLYEDVREEDWTASIMVSAFIIAVAYVASHFVLKPFIFDWVSRNAGLIPLT